MLFRDLVAMQIEINNEWQNILEIKDQLELILNKYNINRKEILEYFLNHGSSEGIQSNRQVLFGKITNFKNTLKKDNFDLIGYQSEILKFQRKCNEVGKENIFWKNLELIEETANEFLKSAQEYYYKDRLYSSYENLMTSVDKFINSVNQLNEQFNYIEFLSEVLEEDVHNIPLENIIELKFFEKLSIKEITSILLFIIQIYDIFKNTLGIEDDLRIIKIETGSFFVKLTGNSIIIGLMTAAFTFLAKEVYYSKANPLKKEEIQIKEFKELLDIKSKMKALNIPTENIDAEIEVLNGLLFKRGKSIIESSNKVEINKTIYKSESSERKEIPFNPKLIKYKEDEVID